MRVRIIAPIALLALATVAAAPAVTADEVTSEEILVVTGEETGETPEPMICEVPEYATALTLDGFDEMITAPDALVAGEGSTDLYFVLDLGTEEAPAYEDTTGTVTGVLSWQVVTNDYDLSVQGNLSDNFQPLDPAEELASATVSHCALVTISAIDFLAPAAVEDLSLSLKVTRKA